MFPGMGGLFLAAILPAGPCLAQAPRSGAQAFLPARAGRLLFGGPASAGQVARLKAMATGDPALLPAVLAGALGDLQPDNPEHQELVAPLVLAETLLRDEAGAALDFGAIVSKAGRLVEAQMRESLAAGSAEELERLKPIVVAYRPQDVNAFDSAYAQRQAARDLAVRMAAELSPQAPAANASADARPGWGDGPALDPALNAIRRELSERSILAPSLVQQYMAQVYHSYPEHDSRGAYAHFIQPLRDARAKRMLHALLIYAGRRPELMSPLPYEQAREHIVDAANRLAERYDTEDDAGLSAALGLYAAELEGLRSRLPPAANATPEGRPGRSGSAGGSPQSPEAAYGPQPQGAALDPAAEEPPTPAHRASPSRAPGLDYFPGWPELTEQYGDMLRGGRMRLVKDEEGARRANDEEIYLIYAGEENVGRLTVRRYADRVERNVLFMLHGRLASFGRSDSPMDDLLRRTRQQAARLWDRLRR